ncbi:hypothetical protein [Cytobacillus oceanisediminis]|uniref:hypothetical protein n=1 Tax=Cytobacillus oceanisediminis TaxID=665099 RepID=UPI00207AC4FE|nr:hypothetical protein [Cytobacillus oceanisediminis]USK46686.1 hypothetical protein LIT27_12805 [Cytobacillus oceanisediminis]
MKAGILDHANLVQASEFIAGMNSLRQCHIGYLGTSQNDILHSLEEMNSDAESAAFIVWKDGAIAGFLGVDADLNKGTAELWGPFVQEFEFLRLLWEKHFIILKETCILTFCLRIQPTILLPNLL